MSKMSGGVDPKLALKIVQDVANDPDLITDNTDWNDFLSGWGSTTIVCIIDDCTYSLSLVNFEGGCEGGGEYVERVIRVWNGETLGYVMINGYYMSYDGTTYDDPSEFSIVEPHEVTVIQYRKLA